MARWCTGMPWSWAAGAKWVHMTPLVEAPQTANAAASSQKGPVRGRVAEDGDGAARGAGHGRRLGDEDGAAVGASAAVGGVVAQGEPHEGARWPVPRGRG